MRPATSSRTPRAATSIARVNPRAPKRAVRDDAQVPQAEQHRAALLLGVELVAQAAQRGLAAAGRRAWSASDDIAAVADGAEQRGATSPP